MFSPKQNIDHGSYEYHVNFILKSLLVPSFSSFRRGGPFVAQVNTQGGMKL